MNVILPTGFADLVARERFLGDCAAGESPDFGLLSLLFSGLADEYAAGGYKNSSVRCAEKAERLAQKGSKSE